MQPTHAARQHRADLFGAEGDNQIKCPDVDFIDWLGAVT
jgi:hypothetical protein